uniref:THAP-type domain-containing protein n=1 Tax=Gadus morhua TaxID=8049 RepID=A0A8C5AWF6_GADMO
MVVQCAFRNCTNKPNRWSTQSFHQFPTRDPERTKLWLVAGGLDIKTPAETARNWKICSDHFRPDDFEKPSNLKSKASLKSNAVPSVFSDAPTATGEQVTHSAASGQPKEIQMPSALEKTVAEDDNPLDLSMSSIEASPSRPVDSSFVPLFSTSSSSSSDIPDILSAAGTKNWSEKKWIVNESKLMQLFTTCQQCGVLIEEEDKKVTTSGTRIHIKWSCMKGHSGSTFTEIFDWAELLNLQIPKKTTFYSLQSTYLIPVIEYAYRDHHEEMMSNLQLQTVGGGISICGDGRSDSPGFSAKYTTYSFMSNATQEIIMVDLVQVNRQKCL